MDLDKIYELHNNWQKGTRGKRADFGFYKIEKVDFSDRMLTAANYRHTIIDDCNFTGTALDHTNFKDSVIKNSVFKNTILDYSTWDDSVVENCVFEDVTFQYNNLISVAFINCKMINCNLNGSNMINFECVNSSILNSSLCNCSLLKSKFIESDLSHSNLKRSNLSDAVFKKCIFKKTLMADSILNYTDLSECEGLLSQAEFIKKNFEFTDEGMLVYKTFCEQFGVNKNWDLTPGTYISENPNPNRTNTCGCGINVAPKKWCEESTRNEIWECLIEWKDLAGVVVPYDTDGKIRAERVKLLRKVERTI